MSSEATKALARRYLQEHATGNLALLEALFAPTLVSHVADRELRGLEPMRAYVHAFRTAFPDGRFVIEDEIAEGDRVAVRWTMAGTHQGPFQGIAPTGRRVTQTGTTIFRVREGRITEVWPQADFLGLLQQLGATLQLPPEQH
jgi:steroid delta-isomerase-like uncharacterized protein